MTEPIDREKLIKTLRAQFECDDFLGAAWLPIEQANIAQAPSPSAAPQPANPAIAPQGVPVDNTNTTYQSTTPPVKKASTMTLEEKRQKLSEIAAAIAQCQKCPLHQTRTRVVPGQGNPDAKIVFVGEAPGQSEDEQGVPFVGRAGKLLEKIIQAMGLSREEVFICNILKCRPPGNRDPQATEIVACNGYLHEQLQILEPEVIVALGAHAARTLLDTKEAIGKLRGRFHEYIPGPFNPPIKLLATYHPAYLLRNYSPDNRRRVWEDMQKVLKEVGLPVPTKNQKS